MYYIFFALLFISLAVYFYKNPGPAVNLPKLIVKPDPRKNERRVVLVGAVAGFAIFLLTGAALPAAIIPVGLYVFFSYQKRKLQKNKKNLFKRDLSDALSLLWIPCDAGLGFRFSVGKLSNKNRVISEMDRCYTEISAGREKEAALKSLSERTVPEVGSLLRSVMYNEEMGAPVSGFLLRETERMQAEKRARIQEIGDKLSSKVLFIVLGVMAPALIAIIFLPISGRFQLFTILN